MSSSFRRLMLAAALVTCVALPAAGQQCEPSGEPLLSNEFFTAISNNEVEFNPDVYWEVVEGASAVASVVRYGHDQAQALTAATALYCRCYQPTVCVENSCEVTGAGTGNAKCRGGCYRANGEACVSCRFFETETD